MEFSTKTLPVKQWEPTFILDTCLMFPPLRRALAPTFTHPHYHTAHGLHPLLTPTTSIWINQLAPQATPWRTPSASASRWSFRDLDRLAVRGAPGPVYPRGLPSARMAVRSASTEDATMTRPRPLQVQKATSGRASSMKSLGEAGTQYRKNQNPSPLGRWPHGSCLLRHFVERVASLRGTELQREVS